MRLRELGGVVRCAHVARDCVNYLALGALVRAAGDALAWSGAGEDAKNLFHWAVAARGLWSSSWCRPSAAFPVASPQPFVYDAPCHAALFEYIIRPFEELSGMIATEAGAALRLHGARQADSGFQRESAGLVEGVGGGWGSWDVLALSVDGALRERVCVAWPATCDLVRGLPELGVRSGQVKLSVLGAGAHVRPHAGPTNARLRMHCGIDIPLTGASMRVATRNITWQNGRCFVFDESCEHELYQRGATPRSVLLVDFANPLLASFEAYLGSLRASERARSEHHHRRWSEFQDGWSECSGRRGVLTTVVAPDAGAT